VRVDWLGGVGAFSGFGQPVCGGGSARGNTKSKLIRLALEADLIMLPNCTNIIKLLYYHILVLLYSLIYLSTAAIACSVFSPSPGRWHRCVPTATAAAATAAAAIVLL
jgi:hypothetical protein